MHDKRTSWARITNLVGSFVPTVMDIKKIKTGSLLRQGSACNSGMRDGSVEFGNRRTGGQVVQLGFANPQVLTFVFRFAVKATSEYGVFEGLSLQKNGRKVKDIRRSASLF